LFGVFFLGKLRKTLENNKGFFFAERHTGFLEKLHLFHKVRHIAYRTSFLGLISLHLGFYEKRVELVEVWGEFLVGFPE
jgi:hypothetical protein